jgi:hypothetical protein
LARSDAVGPDTCQLLAPIYDRFPEGFDTADLWDAKALLDALEGYGKAETMETIEL